MAVLTGAFLRFKLSHVLRDTNGRDGTPIKNDYSFLINRNFFAITSLIVAASNGPLPPSLDDGWLEDVLDDAHKCS